MSWKQLLPKGGMIMLSVRPCNPTSVCPCVRPSHFCPEHNFKTIERNFVETSQNNKERWEEMHYMRTVTLHFLRFELFPFIKFSCPGHNAKNAEGN